MSNLPNRQTGAATIFVAVVLLISITLISFYTGRVVLNQTKLEANNYRTSQALASANAALDYGISYHSNGGLDHNADTTVDYLSASRYNMTISSQITGNTQATSANMYFDNDDSDNAAGEALCSSDANTQSGIVYGIGFSDDGLATRILSQCLGVIPLFKDDGPDQPLISKGAVGLTGNASVINRYSNMTIWAGNTVDIGNSVSMATYLCDTGNCSSSLTAAQMRDTNPANNAQKISSSRLGNGYDVIDEDPILSNLSGDEFFNNFFALTKDGLETVAENLNQHYPAGNVSSDIDGKSSIIWVDGDATINNNITVGSPTSPAVVYINGNLDFSGGPTIYGILYVVGQADISGTVTVVGSTIVEGDPTVVPAGEEPVEGNGTLNLVFAPDVNENLTNNPTGLTNVVDGSWRDW